MTIVVQISDPHFGTEQAPVVEALVRLVAEQKPALIVLSGDITQRAGVEQFAAARRFVDRLATPMLVIPGNHDVPLFNLALRAFAPYRRFAQAFGPDLSPVGETDDRLVIGLRTTRRHRHKNGEVSSRQIESTARRLASARPRQLRIVVTHQPVLVTRPADRANLLRGREAAVRRWSQAGADIVMGGHIHLPCVRPLHDEFDSLPRRLWAVNAGTAVSSRVRHEAPNSVNLLRYEVLDGPRRCVIERWDYRATLDRFQPSVIDDLSFSPDDVRPGS